MRHTWPSPPRLRRGAGLQQHRTGRFMSSQAPLAAEPSHPLLRRSGGPGCNPCYYFQSPEAKDHPLPGSFGKMQALGGSSAWRGTRACPRPHAHSEYGHSVEDLYGSLLSFVGRFVKRRQLAGFPSSCMFLRPPGHAVEETVSINSDGRRCIVLDPELLRSDPLKAAEGGCRAILRDRGNGYYYIRVGLSRTKKHLLYGPGVRKWMTERLHRLVLWCAFGPPPDWEKHNIALHMCGNAACLNPEHLVWGDDATNAIRDDEELARNAFNALLRQQGRWIRQGGG